MGESTEKIIYTIRAAVGAFPEDSWRELQILGDQTVGELGAAVLAAFESLAYHLWNLEITGARFEYNMDPAMMGILEAEGVKAEDPDEMTLAQLKLKKGDQLALEYDYGSPWVFILTVMKEETAAKAKASSYPRLAQGKGGRMIEDVSMFEVGDLIDCQKQGKGLSECPEVEGLISEEDEDWRYDQFNLAAVNKKFRSDYEKILESARRPMPAVTDVLSDLMNLMPPFFDAPDEPIVTTTVPKAAALPKAAARPQSTLEVPAAKASAKKPAPIKIFTFRFEVRAFPDACWREVEMPSTATVGDLAGAVLGAFDAEGGHMWNIGYRGDVFYHYDGDANIRAFRGKPAVPVRAYDWTLGELGLRVRSKLEMLYDFGTTWEFSLRVVASKPAGSDFDPDTYPRLVGGKGGPMMEDAPMFVTAEIIRGLEHGETLENLLQNNDIVAGYLGERFEHIEYPEFDLEKNGKEFRERAHGFSERYSHGGPC